MQDKTIREVALAIRDDWKDISPYAQPYLEAMLELESLADSYFADDGFSIVSYFLANAGTWRGEVAREIKAYLKSLLKSYMQFPA